MLVSEVSFREPSKALTNITSHNQFKGFINGRAEYLAFYASSELHYFIILMVAFFQDVMTCRLVEIYQHFGVKETFTFRRE